MPGQNLNADLPRDIGNPYMATGIHTSISPGPLSYRSPMVSYLSCSPHPPHPLYPPSTTPPGLYSISIPFLFCHQQQNGHTKNVVQLLEKLSCVKGRAQIKIEMSHFVNSLDNTDLQSIKFTPFFLRYRSTHTPTQDFPAQGASQGANRKKSSILFTLSIVYRC